MLWLSVLLMGCVGSVEEEEIECVTFYDKCNSGCDLQCGSTAEKEAIEAEGICDLGCIEDTASTPEECLLVDDSCQWANE